tara:strand:- start:499 stop:1074 length:576 start_codon:yes stop_codon:yes gene_type:complete
MITKCVCWNCKSQYEGFQFFCLVCKKIHKPVSSNAFEQFGLEHKFSIDLKKLEMNYYFLQDRIHPDKFINLSSEESLYSQIHSSNLNSSYEILKNVVSRCDELLKFFGQTIDNENTISDPEILGEVLEIQEKIEIINEEERIIFAREIDDKLNTYVEELDLAFRDNDFQKAKNIKTRISYLQKVFKDLRNR